MYWLLSTLRAPMHTHSHTYSLQVSMRLLVQKKLFWLAAISSQVAVVCRVSKWMRASIIICSSFCPTVSPSPSLPLPLHNHLLVTFCHCTYWCTFSLPFPSLFLSLSLFSLPSSFPPFFLLLPLPFLSLPLPPHIPPEVLKESSELVSLCS